MKKLFLSALINVSLISFTCASDLPKDNEIKGWIFPAEQEPEVPQVFALTPSEIDINEEEVIAVKILKRNVEPFTDINQIPILAHGESFLYTISAFDDPQGTIEILALTIEILLDEYVSSQRALARDILSLRGIKIYFKDTENYFMDMFDLFNAPTEEGGTVKKLILRAQKEGLVASLTSFCTNRDSLHKILSVRASLFNDIYCMQLLRKLIPTLNNLEEFKFNERASMAEIQSNFALAQLHFFHCYRPLLLNHLFSVQREIAITLNGYSSTNPVKLYEVCNPGLNGKEDGVKNLGWYLMMATHFMKQATTAGFKAVLDPRYEERIYQFDPHTKLKSFSLPCAAFEALKEEFTFGEKLQIQDLTVRVADLTKLAAQRMDVAKLISDRLRAVNDTKNAEDLKLVQAQITIATQRRELEQSAAHVKNQTENISGLEGKLTNVGVRMRELEAGIEKASSSRQQMAKEINSLRQKSLQAQELSSSRVEMIQKSNLNLQTANKGLEDELDARKTADATAAEKIGVLEQQMAAMKQSYEAEMRAKLALAEQSHREKDTIIAEQARVINHYQAFSEASRVRVESAEMRAYAADMRAGSAEQLLGLVMNDPAGHLLRDFVFPTRDNKTVALPLRNLLQAFGMAIGESTAEEVLQADSPKSDE
jgi:hypothetical protein